MRFFTKCLFTILFLLGYKDQAFSSTLLSCFEGDKSGVIENCVDTISGSYFETEVDHIVLGSDCIVLQRHYTSKNSFSSKNEGNWYAFSKCFLVVAKNNSSDEINALVSENNGAFFQMSGQKLVEAYVLKFNAKKASGFTNAAREISGQSNLKNHLLKYNYLNQRYELTTPDGTIRYYTKISKPQKTPGNFFAENYFEEFSSEFEVSDYYHLVSEKLPNEHLINYGYDDQGRLASVTIKDNTAKLIIASASFEYLDDKICIKTSDNQEIEYKFKDGRLAEALRPHKPFVQYEYSAYDKNTLLSKKIFPQGRGLEIEYDATCRVMSLKKPAKSDGKMTMVAELLYNDNETEVKNGLGQKNIYGFNVNNQLIKLEKLDKTGKVYRTHRNIWGQKKESGYLIAKTTEDGAGNILVLNQYLYDKRGNIIESKLYGNLIGKETPKIVLNENNELENEEGIDCYKKTFEYSVDGKNLILKEIDSIGNYLLYKYKPDTNLITSKIAFNVDGLINQRFVYDYNEQNILIKISLDGRIVRSSEFTEKHITYITPKMSAPAFGLAEIKEEKVCKYENVRFVKKFQSLFDDKGRIFQEDVFDSNNDLRYSIKFSYDEKGNISSETDPLGNVTSYKFDDNNNLIFKENNQLILNYEYDFENRLISSTATCFDKKTFKSTNQYDLMGNLLVATDKNENATLFSYDEFGRVIKVSYPEVCDENEKRKTPTYQFLYDLLDNVISITDPKGYVTTKNFTIQANPFLINYPDGTKERFKYDNCGSLHRQVTRDGTLWIYEYDFMGRPNNIEHFSQTDTGPGTFLGNKIREYDLFQCISERDEGYAYTKYLYNLGCLDSVRLNDNDFDTKRFTYDEFNRIKSEEFFTNKESNDSFSKIKEYDLLDRVTEERTEAKGQVLERKKFGYDPSGDLIKNISFSKDKELITTIEYDGLHNPKKIIDPLNKETCIENNYKFINLLNQKVLQRTIIDSLGNTQITTYDALDRVVLLIKKDPSGKGIYSEETFYDLAGNKSKIVIHDLILKKDQETRWVHGPMNRLEKLIEGSSSEEMTTTFTYNQLGQLILQQNSKCKLPYDGKSQLDFV